LKIHKNGTELDVKQAIAALLKAAPDRTGGDGRLCTTMCNDDINQN